MRQDVLGEKLGRLHIKRQDLDNMGTRRMAVLREKRKDVGESVEPMLKKKQK